jgi:hypothetical protein
MSIRLIVIQGHETVARVEDYDGPVPRVGDYLFHPDLDDDGTRDMTLRSTGIAGCVKAVTWGLYTRPSNGEAYFVKRAVPVVEVAI